VADRYRSLDWIDHSSGGTIDLLHARPLNRIHGNCLDSSRCVSPIKSIEARYRRVITRKSSRATENRMSSTYFVAGLLSGDRSSSRKPGLRPVIFRPHNSMREERARIKDDEQNANLAQKRGFHVVAATYVTSFLHSRVYPFEKSRTFVNARALFLTFISEIRRKSDIVSGGMTIR